MKTRLLATAACLIALPAAAQVSGTVFGGARAGGGFTDSAGGSASQRSLDADSGAAGAVALNWALDATRQAEIFIARQETDLRRVSVGAVTDTLPLAITYAHFGGTYYFDREHRAGGPYVVGGLGITHFSPGLAGLSSEVRGSMNVGLGWRLPLGPAASLRMELRGYATLINSSGGFFCSGGCVVQIRGDTFTQAEALIGLSIGY